MYKEDTKGEKQVLGSGLIILAAVLLFYAYYVNTNPNHEFNNMSLETGTYKPQQINSTAGRSSGETADNYVSKILTESHEGLTLVSAYTDPLGKKMNMKYILGDNSPVFVELYNSSGQRVMAWDAGSKDRGEYLMTLGIDHLEEGSYYYHFSAGSELCSGKIKVRR